MIWPYGAISAQPISDKLPAKLGSDCLSGYHAMLHDMAISRELKIKASTLLYRWAEPVYMAGRENWCHHL